MTRARLNRSLANKLRADHEAGLTVAGCARKYVVSWTHAKRVIVCESWIGRDLRLAIGGDVHRVTKWRRRMKSAA